MDAERYCRPLAAANSTSRIMASFSIDCDMLLFLLLYDRFFSCKNASNRSISLILVQANYSLHY